MRTVTVQDNLVLFTTCSKNSNYLFNSINLLATLTGTRHDTTQHDTTQHDTTQHDTTQHDTTLMVNYELRP